MNRVLAALEHLMTRVGEKIVDFCLWVHERRHSPKCTPFSNGISYKCPKCGQQWVSAYARWPSPGYVWMEIP